MTTEEARQYFKNKGLTYEDINNTSLLMLESILNFHLAKYLVEGGEHAKQMSMRA